MKASTRQSLIVVLAIIAKLVTFFISAEAQLVNHIPHVGVLYASAVDNADRIQAFQRGLRELGYTEGKNVFVEYRYAEGKLDRYRVLAAELIKSKVDVIVTGGPAATQAVKAATSAIPIVMSQDNDPVNNGSIASLARPGANITGLSTLGAGISGKQVELLKEIVPNLTRMAVIGTSAEPANQQSLKESEIAAEALRVDVQYLNVMAATDFETAFRIATKARAKGVLVLPNAIAAAHRKQLAKTAMGSRLPTIYAHAEFVKAGGLISYGVSYTDLDRHAAIYVDKILKGAKPGDLPVEQPTKFELVINLKTAKQIDLTIPPVLARADKVMK